MRFYELALKKGKISSQVALQYIGYLFFLEVQNLPINKRASPPDVIHDMFQMCKSLFNTMAAERCPNFGMEKR